MDSIIQPLNNWDLEICKRPKDSRPSDNYRKSSNKRPPPLPSLFSMEEYWDNKGCIVLVVFNHKQVIIDSYKHCTLAVATDGSEDLLIHCLKPNQHCAECVPWLKGLYCIVPQERQDASETSEGLTHTYITIKPMTLTSDHACFGQILISALSIRRLPRISDQRLLVNLK